LRTFELFLSTSGISSAFLLFTNPENLLNSQNSDLGKYLLPFLFLFIGLIYFSLFWYREYYYQLTKSWGKRIEQELQIIYKGEQDRRLEDYDGAYRLYYYGTNFNKEEEKFTDISSYIYSTGISFITIIVTFFAYSRFEQDFSFSRQHLALIIGIMILFYMIRELILDFLCQKYECNKTKTPPEIKN
jgi:hypothetical protein